MEESDEFKEDIWTSFKSTSDDFDIEHYNEFMQLNNGQVVDKKTLKAINDYWSEHYGRDDR